MERLENNEIDIMLDIGITPERQKKFLFSNETVLLSWSRLYTQKGINLESVMDLEGKTIAGLKGSFNIEGPEGLKDIIDKFGLNSKIIEMDDYHAVFKAIQSGEVFAGITNKDFGASNELEYNLQRTSIIFQPSRMQFAFPKNSDIASGLLSSIDSNMHQLKENKNSIYFTSLEQNLGSIEVIKYFPVWLRFFIGITITLIVIFFIFNLFLKQQVNQKTKLLQQDIIKRKKAEEELKLLSSMLQAQLESSAEGILAVGMDGKWFGYNQNFIDIWEIPESISCKKNDKLALDFIKNKLLYPESFMTKINELYNNPRMESYDLLELKNDQFLERYSKPQIVGEKIVGRVWSFRNVTNQKQTENEVTRKLSEKETVLKEVHHRVKNNFASISSLLTLQAKSINNTEAQTILKDAIGRVNSMQVLYEKLLFTNNYGNISLKQYLENLIDEIIKLFSGDAYITVKKQIVDIELDSKYMFPIGIIINEILTNIIKYAFNGRDSGIIEVIAEKDQDQISISIHDNGIGLPKDFDISKSEGLGLTLIKMLSTQIEGSFIIENINGTKSTLKFINKTGINE